MTEDTIRDMLADINSVFLGRGIGIRVAVIKDLAPSQIEEIWKLCRDATLRKQSEEKCEMVHGWWIDEVQRAEGLAAELTDIHESMHVTTADKDCLCCSVCSDRPCAACLAGGVCDTIVCRCVEDGDEEDVPF